MRPRIIMQLLTVFLLAFLFVNAQAQNITGTTPVNIGDEFEYAFSDGNTYTSVSWATQYGSVISTRTSDTIYYATIRWESPGTGNLALLDQDHTQRGTLSVTCNVGTPNTTYTIVQNCNATVVTRDTAPPAGVNWYWQTSSSGTSTTDATGTYTQTVTGSLFLRARWGTTGAWSATSQSAGFTGVVTPLPPPATSTDGHKISNAASAVTVSVSNVSTATGYWWYTQSTGGTAIPGQSTTSYSPSLSATTTYYVESVTGNCPSTTRKAVTANVYPEPVLAADHNGQVTMGQSVTLSVSNMSYDTYQWYQVVSGSNSLIGGATSPTYTTSTVGSYNVKVTKATSNAFTTATAQPIKDVNSQGLNYIISNTILADNILIEDSIKNLPVASNNQTIQYFDGLGRPVQTVVTQGSPARKDIVQPVAYDAYGREVIKYLPYTSTQNNGWYKTSALTSLQAAYYNTPADNLVADDSNAYAVTQFEASPLNRVLKQGAPGAAWQPDADPYATTVDHTVKMGYEVNVASEVLKWTFTPNATYSPGLVSASSGATPIYYDANQLTKTKSKDADQHEVIEFKDLEGRMILRKVQAGATEYAQTYYVYDDFGQLVCVIPPEAVKAIIKTPSDYFNQTAAVQSSFLVRWAFRYKYDSRHRMISKQIPGADSVTMVYDKRDRLVMSQDGNQRPQKNWTFIKYDVLNRPVLTGIITADSVLSQPKMQRRVDYYYNNLGTNGGAWYESAGTAVHGYDNKSYPLESNANNYLTVTYYDNYDFRSSWNGIYTYLDESLSATQNSITYDQPDNENTNVTGQVTGTKVKVLDGGITGGYTWLKTVSYYDDKYRVIQTLSDNYKGGTDRITNVHDFAGKVLKSKSTHAEYDVQWKDFGGASVIGNKLYRTAPVGGWGESGAVSKQILPASADGWMEVVVSEMNSARIIGVTDNNPDLGYANMLYALYINGTQLKFYELSSSGVQVATYGQAIASGDVLRIERTGTTVKFYRNGSLIRTSAYSSSTQWMVDASLYNITGVAVSLVNVRCSFCGTTNTITRRFEYDHAGRLLKTYHKLNAEDEVLLAQSEYNEVGQLIDKKLHSISGSAPKQSIDHRYNIRGWLTSINDAALTPDGSDAKDLFGMNLDYNTTTSGLGNSAMYNGNISGITWSRNLGLADVKQNGYAYSYDPMNRITAAAFKEKNSSWATPTASAFSESGYTYDLNGNIKSLLRYDKRGSTTVMDNLTYDYGTTTTQSNKLLKVTDSGDDNAGFKEFNTTAGDDYAYDANGNLIWDKNKGGEDILTNGDFDNGSASWTLTDTGSKLTFTSGRVDVASGSAIARLTQGTAKDNALYIALIDLERTSGSAVTLKVGGVTNTISATGQYAFAVTATQTNSIYIEFPANFVGKLNKFQVKGLVVISYNFLNLVEKVTAVSDKQLTYIYDATGRKLSQDVHDVSGTLVMPEKSSDYEGAYFYENDTLKFINTEEGRIVMTGATPEYQYHLKDHLGNVRMTFTTKGETESATGTLEDANATAENAKFLRYTNAKRVQSTLFDHTNGASTGYAERLNGTTNEKYGIARSVSVMPGDTLKLEVYAKYVDSNTSNWTGALTTLMGQIAGGGSPTVVDGAGYSSSTTSFPFAGLLNTSSSTGGPKAYLNWLIFDRDYNFLNGGYQRMSTAAKEYGQDVAHEKLSATVGITQPGYVYIYLSNEETSAVEVFFDDLKVEQIKSPVIQTDDYYPFGLTFNSYQRENSITNQFLYNGKEKQGELNLAWYDYQARQYDPTIARWMVIDPLSELSRKWSPYAYCYNNPLLFVDPDGMFGDFYDEQGKKLGTDGNSDGKNYVVTDKSEAKAIRATDKNKGTTQVSAIKSATQLPSYNVRTEMGKAVDKSNAANTKSDSSDPNFKPDSKGGFHEEGGIFGTRDGQEAVVHAEPGDASNPDVDRTAEVSSFSGEGKNGDPLDEIDGTFHVHCSGTGANGGTFATEPSNGKNPTTGLPEGDIPNARENSNPAGAYYVKGNSYVLSPKNNKVYIYNGNGTVATFPLDKFRTIK